MTATYKIRTATAPDPLIPTFQVTIYYVCLDEKPVAAPLFDVDAALDLLNTLNRQTIR